MKSFLRGNCDKKHCKDVNDNTEIAQDSGRAIQNSSPSKSLNKISGNFMKYFDTASASQTKSNFDSEDDLSTPTSSSPTSTSNSPNLSPTQPSNSKHMPSLLLHSLNQDEHPSNTNQISTVIATLSPKPITQLSPRATQGTDHGAKMHNRIQETVVNLSRKISSSGDKQCSKSSNNGLATLIYPSYDYRESETIIYSENQLNARSATMRDPSRPNANISPRLSPSASLKKISTLGSDELAPTQQSPRESPRESQESLRDLSPRVSPPTWSPVHSQRSIAITLNKSSYTKNEKVTVTSPTQSPRQSPQISSQQPHSDRSLSPSLSSPTPFSPEEQIKELSNLKALVQNQSEQHGLTRLNNNSDSTKFSNSDGNGNSQKNNFDYSNVVKNHSNVSDHLDLRKHLMGRDKSTKLVKPIMRKIPLKLDAVDVQKGFYNYVG